jgi:hypothetical protein
VTTGVVKHIDEGSADFARGSELPNMVAVRKYRTLAGKRAIGRAGKPNRKALHPPGEAVAVFAFEDEVNVVALDAVLDKPGAKASTS